jgi:predicted  nucleic acid-binding Zn-ribbon protein
MHRDEKLARAREALREAQGIAIKAAARLVRLGTSDRDADRVQREIVYREDAVNVAMDLRSQTDTLIRETLALLDEPDAAEEKPIPFTRAMLEHRLYCENEGGYDQKSRCAECGYDASWKAPPPEPARTVLSDVDPRNMTRLMLLDRVRELEEIVKWKGEHTDALEKNWNSLVEIARAQRDTARERVKELEDEQRWRESENGNLIGDLRRELATERAAHERTKADAAAGVGLIRRKLELDPLAFEGDSLAAKKILEGDAGRSLIAHADGRIKDLERALANEKAAHEATLTELSNQRHKLWDLQAKLAEANAARDHERERVGDLEEIEAGLNEELTQERERYKHLASRFSEIARDLNATEAERVEFDGYLLEIRTLVGSKCNYSRLPATVAECLSSSSGIKKP